MRLPTMYLETTIFNFPFVNDAPNFRADTLKLFEEIKAGKFRPFTSGYVIQELESATDARREERIQLIKEYRIEVIPISAEAERLANLYIKEGVVSAKYGTDATHIAVATIAGLDFIVSLNFKHIVKRKTKIGTGFINAREGYRQIDIHTPAEVIDENT